MGFPVGPYVPVLMVSLSSEPLYQAAWSGRLPNVAIGEAFWASSRDVPGLLAAGLAELAPEGTPAPPAEPAWTAHGQPGFAAGTSNSSHQWVPSAGGTADGGGPAPAGQQDYGGVIDGGPPDGGTPAGTLDGGSP
jgi:hypothetical protein